MIDILLKYEFLNDLDAQSAFDKKIVTKNSVKYNHSYLKYALDLVMSTGIFWEKADKTLLLYKADYMALKLL